VLAAWLRSDLEIPQPVPKLLSLYLLLAIGFKGGVELNRSGMEAQMLIPWPTALVVAIAMPLGTFAVLKKRLGAANAAAVAATYGSVSAVTFITAVALLSQLQIPSSGWMVAAMALMESPAIVVGVLLARRFATTEEGHAHGWGELLREAFFNGSVFVLVGSMVIGVITGASGETALAPFTSGIFKACSASSCSISAWSARVGWRRAGSCAWCIAAMPVAAPLVHGAIGVAIARLLGLGRGDALLFTVLCASASYIAVPAAMRLAIPKASPGIYVPMALAITFPFNVVIGLPLYLAVINHLWS
jgi:hypothetical protein